MYKLMERLMCQHFRAILAILAGGIKSPRRTDQLCAPQCAMITRDSVPPFSVESSRKELLNSSPFSIFSSTERLAQFVPLYDVVSELRTSSRMCHHLTMLRNAFRVSTIEPSRHHTSSYYSCRSPARPRNAGEPAQIR